MLTLITNRHICGEARFIETVIEAIRGGVDRVILREKDLDTMALRDFGKIFKAEMKPYQDLIVHSDVEAAGAISADGVQMTYCAFMAMSDEELSYLMEEMHMLVGVSVHNLAEAEAAASRGASYLLASHVFDTECKAGVPGRGISFIKEICDAVDIPVIGLGGIGSANASQVIDAGATGVALMSGIMGAGNVRLVCENLVNIMSILLIYRSLCDNSRR